MTEAPALARMTKALAAATDLASKAQASNLILTALVSYLLADACARKPDPERTLLAILSTLHGQFDAAIREDPGSVVSRSLSDAILLISDAAETTLRAETR